MTTESLGKIRSSNSASITAIVVNYCTPQLTIQCLECLATERMAGVPCDAIVVDGFSTDGSIGEITDGVEKRGYGDWVTFAPLTFNGGFGWANNFAISNALRRANPPNYILLINPDAAIQPGAISNLKRVLDNDADIAAAGSQLFDHKDTQVGSAFLFPSIGNEFVRGSGTPWLGKFLRIPSILVRAESNIDADWVTGASVLLRAQALREVGLFDEGFFLYFEEVELMHRMRRAGWRVVHVPGSRVRHVGGAATGIGDGAQAPRRLPDYWFRSRRRFFTLAYGRMAAIFASLAWIAGLMFWRLRCLVGLGRASAHAPFELKDLLRNGIFPTAADRRVSASAWDSPPSALPAWKEAP